MVDDLRETRLQDLLREKARPDCVSDHTLDARFGCDESSQVCRGNDVSRSLEPNSGLACTEGCLCRAVLRETREEPFERRSHRRFQRLVSPARFCGRALAECGCCDGHKTFTLEQILSAGPGTVECVRALLQ